MGQRRRVTGVAVVLLAGFASGCGGGGGGGGAGTGSGPRAAFRSPLVLAAGMVALEPAAGGTGAEGVDLDRLGLDDVDVVYDLTTPAGAPFLFDALTRRRGNGGGVRLSLAHASDDGNTPVGGPETLAGVGVIPSVPGAVNRAPWLDAHGDGFGRISLRGSIDRDQSFVLEADADGMPTRALVRVRIGDESSINLAAQAGGDYPGVLEETVLYSSNSWMFGLPTVAVSGDRSSVVVYEGDRSDPTRYQRWEMRLQHDRLTGLVTGGASDEAGPDSGSWRDHEIAALFNVLALVRSGSESVSVRLSFDRGATFAEEKVLARASGDFLPRLVQTAMAADYSLAVLFWQSTKAGATDLVLVEGRPSAFDGGGSPTRYEFDPAVTVHRVTGDVTPAIMGAAWSGGGDLVIGYAFSSFTSNPDGTWTSLTENRCAVRPFGGTLRDTLVEEERIVGRDPSVSVSGSGDTMKILYAYEASDGVRLRSSTDAGRTFGPPLAVGNGGAWMPTVLARPQDGLVRVDVLYLAAAPEGTELRVLHWDDFEDGASVDHRLTRATAVPSASVPGGGRVPGASLGMVAPEFGSRIRQVSWAGYDAVLDGDDVVVVVNEETFDAWIACGGGWFPGDPVRNSFDGGPEFGAAEFTPADPPPPAPGLTEPAPTPDPEHMHQLTLIRLD